MKSFTQTASNIDKLFSSTNVNPNVIESLDIKLIQPYIQQNGTKQPYSINQNELEALKQSISNIGQITPIICRKKNGKYEILSGHKRFLAMQQLGKATVKAQVISVSDDTEAAMLVMSANVQRKDTKPSEFAKMITLYEKLRTSNKITKENFAKEHQLSIRTYDRYLKLSQMNESIIEAVDNGLISLMSVEPLYILSKGWQQKVAEYCCNLNKKINEKTATGIKQYVIDTNSINATPTQTQLDEALKYAQSQKSEKEKADNQNEEIVLLKDQADEEQQQATNPNLDSEIYTQIRNINPYKLHSLSKSEINNMVIKAVTLYLTTNK